LQFVQLFLNRESSCLYFATFPADDKTIALPGLTPGAPLHTAFL
jgi:hypothetical protein